MHTSTTLLSLFAAAAWGLPQVEIKGNQFYFTGTGSEFKVRGLAYQPGGQSAFKGDGDDKHDPLSIPEICKRDAPVIQSLGANVVRVYNLHSDLNHDECVTVFNNAGIYLMLDVNSPLVNSHINKENPSSTYHRGYLENIFKTMDAFKGYDNVIGFFSGNEIIDTKEHAEENTPYLRAVVRDMKRYLARHSDRFIAVGYAATDTRSESGAGADSVTDLWNYLRCSSDEEDDMARSDFFAVNIYSWCADATWQESGYPELVQDFNETSLPVFWSEHGCNVNPRLFNEVPDMYGRDEMIKTFSGGVVFEYSDEENEFGLVKIDEDDGSVELLNDFHALSDQYDSVDWEKISNIKEDSITVIAPPKCSDITILGDTFPSDFSEVPEMPEDANDLMENGSGNTNLGKLLDNVNYDHDYKIRDGDEDVTSQYTVKVHPDAGVSDAPRRDPVTGSPGGSNDDGGSGAGHALAGIAAVVAPLLASVFLL
ncbi:1,3-beta-glucanosyltransferase gel2 [Paramyrothecium foliicola]|nr:1,3-beta-glucanosyltransferase gel2 [Paramyrothecium foliicola]